MLRKVIFGVLTFMLALGSFILGGNETKKAEAATSESTNQMVNRAVSDYFTSFRSEISKNQDGSYAISYNGKTMRFFMETKGSPDSNGKYPLYITLHGGGGTAAESNDEQWRQMSSYYKGSVTNGIYIACRGITDTWDLHFQKESYFLYDKIIKTMIAKYNADPNRVYLLGFSAGGDGVYQILPRMADRFAAGNMSSGHPNSVSLINLANCPISIQVGVRDYYSRSALRCVRAAEFEKTLSDYNKTYQLPYEHRVLIHVPAGHNYRDNQTSATAYVLADPTSFANKGEGMLNDFVAVFEKTENASGMDDARKVNRVSYLPLEDNNFNNEIKKVVTDKYKLAIKEVKPDAITYLSQFKRNPLPNKIIWDLGTRTDAQESFYWLQADNSVNKGIISASIDKNANTISLKTDNVSGDFSILISPYMLDVSKPIQVVTPNGRYSITVEPSQAMVEESLQDRGDPNLVYVAKLKYNVANGNIEAEYSSITSHQTLWEKLVDVVQEIFKQKGADGFIPLM
ncbi:MAG: hypothetical protein IKZ58_08950 [Selenomonadaceae bacterium]|nr:hypothetical protein [Selenomonadaceae bacterium]